MNHEEQIEQIVKTIKHDFDIIGNDNRQKDMDRIVFKAVGSHAPTLEQAIIIVSDVALTYAYVRAYDSNCKEYLVVKVPDVNTGARQVLVIPR